DRRGDRVGGGHRLAPRRLQRDAEGVRAVVGRGERVVGREGRLAVGAREVGRSAVAGRGVAERVPRLHGDVEGVPGGRRRRRRDREDAGRGRADGDEGAAGGRRGERVGGG